MGRDDARSAGPQQSEVRDADDSLLSSESIESTILCTEAEARALLKGMHHDRTTRSLRRERLA